MLFLEDHRIHSASDLTGFLACGHLPFLRAAAARGELDTPGGGASLASRYGDLHERAYLERLRAEGLTIKDLTRPDAHASLAALRAAHDATVEALAEGYDVVYQGTLFDGTWLGHPDFLVRHDDHEGMWPFSYDVVDTKLARHARAGALVQTALYGELLGTVQGCPPLELRLALGDGTSEAFPFADVAAYARAVRERFLEALEQPAPYPYPVEHCQLCAWSEHCEAQRQKDDHLSLVADIRRRQILELEGAGIPTLEALATVSESPPVHIGDDTLARLRRQAAEQLRSRMSRAPSFALIEPADPAGLASLPAPDDGDVFFDMEGFPYAEDGGLEYLFGWVDQAGEFHHLFAENRGEERRAFEAFMDEIARVRAADPGMHIYHYAPYEPSALVRLSNRHGVREEEVDRTPEQVRLVNTLCRFFEEAVVVRPEYAARA